jgi:hypothetical protein
MPLYALVGIADDTILDMRDFADVPPDLTRKGIRWLPVAVTDPAFDPATEVKAGPVLTVEADRVTRAWTIRRMTAEEADAARTSAVDSLDALAFRIAFNHENRLRALEGKPAATTQQFRTALKALL